MTDNMPRYDVAIIGAGPAGAYAAKLLRKQGHSVLVLERSRFPRFSIGESLLPACMNFLEEAELLADVQAAGFQIKNGATFKNKTDHHSFDFSEGFSEGWGHTYQVQRDRFDDILARSAERAGAVIRFGCSVKEVSLSAENCVLTCSDETGNRQTIRSRFCLDASGAGQVLARKLDLSLPSDFPVRQAVFAHFHVPGSDTLFERNKITVSIHPDNPDVWYWIIPFEDGTCSIGAVGKQSFFKGIAATSNSTTDTEALFQAATTQNPFVQKLLEGASLTGPVRQLTGYSSNIKQLHGDGYAILGNAGEFLDPIFSSGVTIAFKSASLAVDALCRQLRGEPVNWDAAFSKPLQSGVDVFRVYVDAWYDGTLPKVFFHPSPNKDVVRMLCSILAGYVWDGTNPYVRRPLHRLNALIEICSLR